MYFPVLLLLFSSCVISQDTEDELIMVQIFMRHCKRTPEGGRYDPLYEDFWRTVETYNPRDPFPAGKITKLGSIQMETYGKFLRQMYIEDEELIPDRFDQRKVFFKSSAANDRTMMSTPSIVEGLYPGSPVPIYSDLPGTDPYTYLSGNCPSYEIEYPRKDREIEAMLDAQYADFFARLATVSALPQFNLTTRQFLDGLDQNIDNGLDHFQPNYHPLLYEAAAEITAIRSETYYTTMRPDGPNDPRGTLGANALRLVIQNFQDAIAGDTAEKLRVYVGHDILTLPPLWITLGLGVHIISSGGATHLELWRRNGEYRIEMKHATSDVAGLSYSYVTRNLECPNPDESCNFDDFISHFESRNPIDGCCYVGPSFAEAGCADFLNPATADIPACRSYRQHCPRHACGPGQIVDSVTMRCVQVAKKQY